MVWPITAYCRSRSLAAPSFREKNQSSMLTLVDTAADTAAAIAALFDADGSDKAQSKRSGAFLFSANGAFRI